jgi:hypothetical protein
MKLCIESNERDQSKRISRFKKKTIKMFSKYLHYLQGRESIHIVGLGDLRGPDFENTR